MRKDGRFLHVLLVSVLAAALPLKTNCRPPARQSRSQPHSLTLSAIEDVLRQRRSRAHEEPCQNNQPPTARDLRKVIKSLLHIGTPPYAVIELVVDALRTDEQENPERKVYSSLGNTDGLDSRNIALPYWLNRYANQKREDQVDRSRAHSDVTNPWFEADSPLYRDVMESSIIEQGRAAGQRAREADMEELGLLLVEMEEEEKAKEEEEEEEDDVEEEQSQAEAIGNKAPHRFPPVSPGRPRGIPPGIGLPVPQRFSPDSVPRFSPGQSRGFPPVGNPSPPELGIGLSSHGNRGHGPSRKVMPPVVQAPPANTPFREDLPSRHHQQPQQQHTFHRPSTHELGAPSLVNILPIGVEIVVSSQVPDETYVTRIPLSPMMSVYEALYQAGIEYDSGLNDHNPFDFGIGTLEERQCLIVDSMGDLSADDRYHWVITVIDETGQVVWEDACFPSRKRVPVKGGYQLKFSYASRVYDG